MASVPPAGANNVEDARVAPRSAGDGPDVGEDQVVKYEPDAADGATPHPPRASDGTSVRCLRRRHSGSGTEESRLPSTRASRADRRPGRQPPSNCQGLLDI